MGNINKKLKAIYFHWVINYAGPPPRSLSSTFEDYLYLERYTFLGDDRWLEKVLAECNLVDKVEFDEQMVLIEEQFNTYSDQQQKKRDKRMAKAWKTHLSNCDKEGILPF